jgi:hypothetical protein
MQGSIQLVAFKKTKLLRDFIVWDALVIGLLVVAGCFDFITTIVGFRVGFVEVDGIYKPLMAPYASAAVYMLGKLLYVKIDVDRQVLVVIATFLVVVNFIVPMNNLMLG